MPLFHKVRRKQVRLTRMIALTVFWAIFLFTIAMSALSVHYIGNIQYRRDMTFINYNLPFLIQTANDAPEEIRDFIHFNINCMLLQVKMVRDNLELYTLVILFFYLNTIILLFVLYRRNKNFLYGMSFILIILMYFTFTYSQQTIRDIPKRVLGNLYLNEQMLQQLE